MENEINLSNAILFADCHHGIYCPKVALSSLDRDKCEIVGADEKDIETVLNGPDEEIYCDAWIAIESCTIREKETGKEWFFYQDGDIWLVPAEDMKGE